MNLVSVTCPLSLSGYFLSSVLAGSSTHFIPFQLLSQLTFDLCSHKGHDHSWPGLKVQVIGPGQKLGLCFGLARTVNRWSGVSPGSMAVCVLINNLNRIYLRT